MGYVAWLVGHMGIGQIHMENHSMNEDLPPVMATNISRLSVDIWPNVVLLRDGYWFVAEHTGSSVSVGNTTFLEFDIAEDVDYQFLKNRYEIGKCINGNRSMRPRLSVNVGNIISIQQYES